MDQERQRIEEDLRGVVSGDVICDDVGRSLYATDGSLFEVQPLVVVRPRTAEDVAATVRWAAERGVPVHARGAGSSVAGGPRSWHNFTRSRSWCAISTTAKCWKSRSSKTSSARI
jgi:hypothetical protein